MIIPSIDLMDGAAVQLVEGREKVLDAGDPRPLAERFGVVGEIAVIDLDAALGQGDNRNVIRDLLTRAPCRVGGGIRDVQTAIDWLDAGARKVILGTAARPEILRELPRDRVIAAVDARHDEVVVEGWTRGAGARLDDRIAELREYVGGFLVTFVEREGRMGGLPVERIRALRALAGEAELTVAGGVQGPEDIAAADQAGADAQVGMALYTGAISLADAFAAPLTTDRTDGLWPTIVADERGVALGLAYSSRATLAEAIDSRRGVYHSRSRGGRWAKGETSGAVQTLLAVDADCDRDALRFTVRQADPGFCHRNTRTCFGEEPNTLAALERTIRARITDAPAGSYTRRLLDDPTLLRSKLIEEAAELAAADNAGDASWEAADVLYFALVAALGRGAALTDIEARLRERARKITRRPGDAKPTVTGDVS